jgi:hypothetical protein
MGHYLNDFSIKNEKLTSKHMNRFILACFSLNKNFTNPWLVLVPVENYQPAFRFASRVKVSRQSRQAISFIRVFKFNFN